MSGRASAKAAPASAATGAAALAWILVAAASLWVNISNLRAPFFTDDYLFLDDLKLADVEREWGVEVLPSGYSAGDFVERMRARG